MQCTSRSVYSFFFLFLALGTITKKFGFQNISFCSFPFPRTTPITLPWSVDSGSSQPGFGFGSLVKCQAEPSLEMFKLPRCNNEDGNHPYPMLQHLVSIK